MTALYTATGILLLFSLVLYGLVHLCTWVSDHYEQKEIAASRAQHDAHQDAIDALTPDDRAWLTTMGYQPPPRSWENTP